MDISEKIMDGRIFFSIVMIYDYLEVVRLFFLKGVDEYIVDNDGWNVLYIVSYYGYVIIFELLLEFGVEVDCMIRDNLIFFFFVVKSG